MEYLDVRICTIAGGSGAGKTTLAFKLLDLLGDNGSHHTIDWYYRDQSHLSAKDRAAVNFDHPDSLDVDLFVHDLATLRSGQPIKAPVYDFATHTRTTNTLVVPSRRVIVAEGIHLLALPSVRDMCDLNVYIDVAAELRLERRIRRDVVERGRTPESVRSQWMTTVHPMHQQFVQPSAANADRVVAADEDLDDVAAELAAQLLA